MLSRLITKGSSSGATLSFALRSKGEGGQPSYLIIQEVAAHFRYHPPKPPLHPVTNPKNRPQNTVIYMGFVTFASKNHFLQHAETCVNTSVFARCCPKNTVNIPCFLLP